MAPLLLTQAPAKINPVLEVLGKRPDGYHELALVFQTIGLYDELTFEKAKEGVSFETSASLPADDSNLVVKAAKLFHEEVLRGKGGVRVHLNKVIPIAAGLGGGSSDAAATLKRMDALFETQVGEKKLQAMAAQLGSDVPFFLSGGTALGRGRGEQITPWEPGPEIPLILVKPKEGLSTPAVYQSGKALITLGEKAQGFKDLLREKNLRKIAGALFNGLEPATFFLMPEVKLIKEELLAAGVLGALVSGSGPTVFGIAPTVEAAAAIGRKLEGNGRTVIVTKTVLG
jgi:4-diphosphocytidyl-2-C-methyl-D-erythritol kinase